MGAVHAWSLALSCVLGGIAKGVARSAVANRRDRGRKRVDDSRQAVERKAALKVAYIGAAATVLAAIIGGIFVLASVASHGSPGNGIPTGSYTYGNSHTDLGILSVAFGQVGTREIISVTGIARNVPADLSVYAVAKPGTTKVETPTIEPGTNTVSWFVAGPAVVGRSGLWSVEIDISPPETGKVTITAVEARNVVPSQCPPQETCPGLQPRPPTAAEVKVELANRGSGSTAIPRTSSPRRVTIPSR